MENAAQANPTAPQKSSRTAVLLGIAFSILINGVLPFIIYTALTNYTSLSNYIALVLTGVPSLIDSIVGILRRKRMDILAGIVLTGIAVSLILIALGGSPKVYLIRESFFTVALAIAYLISLLFPRPLAFYFARHFSTGNRADNVAWFNTLWQYPQFRHTMRVITAVWGIGFLLEAAIRTYLVIVLSTAQFLIVSPFVFYGFLGGIMLWTFLYSMRGRRRAAELRKQLAVEQEAGNAS
ncbi:MAG TPA: VC0807 family protein [Ktedonobacteraceae bacterium]|nr:VC0807 family protein [Ktedonobacteraceae bacterium]